MLNQSSLDLAFQALADPSRRAMIAHLAQGPASVSDLARPLAMSLPAVMQHLAMLEGAGLVRSEKTGRVRTCRVDPLALRQVEAWIAGLSTVSIDRPAATQPGLSAACRPGGVG